MTSFRVENNQVLAIASTLHGPYAAAAVRQGERIACKVIRPGVTSTQIQVWRISPFGLEIVAPDWDLGAVGQHLSLQLSIAGQSVDYAGVIVAKDYTESKKSLIGIRTQAKDTQARDGDSERRGHSRWMCSPLFYPSGSASNPARFADPILFRVREMSLSGMQVLTSMRNRYLVPDIELKSSMTFPIIGKAEVSFRIVSVKVVTEGTTQYQQLGVSFVELSRKAQGIIGQYILQFGQIGDRLPSPKELKKHGFGAHSAVNAIHFDFVKTNEEYEQVLALRFLAFGSAGELAGQTCPADMADQFDARSRILIGKYRGRIVASVRIAFHDSADKFEHEQYLVLPGNLPPRELIVEASRACTDPDYRGADILFRMFAYTVLVTLQSGRRYILQSCIDPLLPVYSKFGFRPLGLAFSHKVLGGVIQNLVLTDLHKGLKGKYIHPLIYNMVMGEIGDLMEVIPEGGFDAIARLRIALYKISKPILHFYQKRVAKRYRAKKSN